MPYRENHLSAPDGTRLFERGWLPEGGARAVVTVVHGFTEHSGRYQWFAEQLNARGYAVYAADLRGHGRSEGPQCYIVSFDEYLNDLDAVLADVRRRQPGNPIFVFGHSMGGLIVALYSVLRKPEVRGIVVSGAVLRVGAEVYPILRRMARFVSRFFPRIRLVRLGSGYISRDPAVLADFRNDPMVFLGRFPIRTGAEILRAVALLSQQMEAVRLPLLIMHGTADRACDCEGGRELYRRAASEDKTLRLYEGLYHAIFWEPERAQVMADLIEWLDART